MKCGEAPLFGVAGQKIGKSTSISQLIHLLGKARPHQQRLRGHQLRTVGESQARRKASTPQHHTGDSEASGAAWSGVHMACRDFSSPCAIVPPRYGVY